MGLGARVVREETLEGSTSSRQSLLYKHNGGAYMAPFSLLAPSEAFWAVRLTVTVSEIIR